MPDHIHLLVMHSPIAGRDAFATVNNDDFIAGRDACAVEVNKNLTERASLPADVNKKQYTLSDLMHTIKSYFGQKLHHDHGFDGPIWQPRFNFRIIDNDERLRKTVEYIKGNPQKENLPQYFTQQP